MELIISEKNGPTICLSMIVKDEEPIIVQTLENLCANIKFSYWVISDTGSTDNTKQLITSFFAERKIPGELIEHEWKDFGYNRTKALECAYNKTDYLLIFDADDKIVGELKIPDICNADKYQLTFGKGFTYTRPLFITNRKKWCFKGVLHESLSNIEPINGEQKIEGNYYVESGRTGNRSKNPNKYVDDAVVLQKAFDTEFKTDYGMACRYAFYCAQSYKDSGPTHFNDAITWYKKVLELDNWSQEKYVACYTLGNLYKKQKDVLNATKYWLKTIEYDGERIEGIIDAMEYYRETGQHILVNALYHKYKNYNKMLIGKLFLYQTKYEDELEYNNSICSYYVNDLQSGYDCCKQILINNKLSIPLLKLTMRNMMFYKNILDKELSENCGELCVAITALIQNHCTHNDNDNDSSLSGYNELLNLLRIKTQQISYYPEPICCDTQSMIKKCIFICVFNNDNYIKLTYLLLESIYIYGNIDNETDILIYTSTAFMNIIKNSNLCNDRIKFELNDNYNDIDSACKSRLDLFDLPTAQNYKVFLYLDSDVLIKNNIRLIFELNDEDTLYALEEGRIDNDPHDWWGGKTLFSSDEIALYKERGAFNSGVLLFNNSEKIKALFTTVKQHFILNNNRGFNDQPYIVYNAFKYNLINNKKMKSCVSINDHNIHTNKTIIHFCGNPGIHQQKMVKMTTFLTSIKDFTILTHISRSKKFIDELLIPIVKNIGEPLEGNIFMTHHTLTYTNAFENKVKNISNLVLNKNIKNVLEIGFNSGFSALLMLLSNPTITVTCVDLGEHKYTLPCYEQIKKLFGDRINIIIGDSTIVLPTLTGTYDLIHIDGGHETSVASSDIIYSYKLSHPKTILIMDDYDFRNLHLLWDEYIIKYNLKSIDNHTYASPHHDIKMVSQLID